MMFGAFGDSFSYGGVTGNRNPLQMHRSQFSLFNQHPRSSVSRSSTMPAATVEATKKPSFEEKFLESHIDPNYGLLEKLMASGTLSQNEYETIHSNGSVLKKNQELMTIYKAKNQYSILLNMLKETGQEHLNNYIHSKLLITLSVSILLASRNAQHEILKSTVTLLRTKCTGRHIDSFSGSII